jgi:hypothetical protein
MWFEVVEVIWKDIWIFFGNFFSSINRGKNVYKGLLLVWHAVLLVLWQTRNDKIFSNKAHTIGEVLDIFKCTSHGNGYWLKKSMHHVCTMNDMLIL